jgi:hypothetical protein
MSGYEKTKDEILDALLTDIVNAPGNPDTSKGTLLHTKSAAFASGLWGLYKYAEWIRRQIFPQTADADTLVKHCAMRGITRQAGETDAELLVRLLERLRNPAVGFGYGAIIKWVKDVTIDHSASDVREAETVYALGDVRLGAAAGSFLYICIEAGESGTEAPDWPTEIGGTVDDGAVTWRCWAPSTFVERVTYCAPQRCSRGPGTFDVVIGTNYDHSIVGFAEPSAELVVAVGNVIRDAIPPFWASDPFVVAVAEKIITQVAVVVPAGTSAVTLAKVEGDIITHMRSLGTGETLYYAKIVAILVDNNIPDYVSVTPDSDVACYPDETHAATYQRIWPYDASGVAVVTVAEAE